MLTGCDITLSQATIGKQGAENKACIAPDTRIRDLRAPRCNESRRIRCMAVQNRHFCIAVATHFQGFVA
jgi:hypothetical protein